MRFVCSLQSVLCSFEVVMFEKESSGHFAFGFADQRVAPLDRFTSTSRKCITSQNSPRAIGLPRPVDTTSLLFYTRI